MFDLDDLISGAIDKVGDAVVQGIENAVEDVGRSDVRPVRICDRKVKIFGGTFIFSEEMQRFVLFRRHFLVPLSRYLDDELIAKKIAVLGQREFENEWETEVAKFSENVAKAVHGFSHALGYREGEIWDLLDMIGQRFVGQIVNTARDAASSINEMANSGESFAEIQKARLASAGVVLGQMNVGVDAMSNLIIEELDERGLGIKSFGSDDDCKKAEQLFGQLKSCKVATDKTDATKLKILKLNPEYEEFIEWCWTESEDKTGPICAIAEIVGVSLERIRNMAFDKLVGVINPKTIKEAEVCKKRVADAGVKLGVDVNKLLSDLDRTIYEFDRAERTVSGHVFDTKEEAAKQKEIAECAASHDLATEEDALAAKKELEALAKKLAVDASWKLDAIIVALNSFDLVARTVDGREFSSRDEAAKQRELSEFEKNIQLASEGDALKSKMILEKRISELGIDGEWKLVRVNDALKKFDEDARTAFGVIYETRGDALTSRGDKKSFFDAIVKLIADADAPKFYLKEKIPPKKLQNARAAYLNAEKEKGVFALLDTTMFGSGKCGLAVSEWGFAWRNDNGPASPVSAYTWRDFAKNELCPSLEKGSENIRFDKDAIYANLGSDVDVKKVLEVLIGFWRYSQQADFNKWPSDVVDERRKVRDENDPQTQKNIVESVMALKQDGIFAGANIPTKKKMNAFVAMRVEEPIESISVLVDATVFGSAKEGLVLTDSALYFKNFMEDPVRIAIEDLKEIVADDKAIRINDKRFTPSIFSKEVMGSFSDVLMGLRREV